MTTKRQKSLAEQISQVKRMLDRLSTRCERRKPANCTPDVAAYYAGVALLTPSERDRRHRLIQACSRLDGQATYNARGLSGNGDLHRFNALICRLRRQGVTVDRQAVSLWQLEAMAAAA